MGKRAPLVPEKTPAPRCSLRPNSFGDFGTREPLWFRPAGHERPGPPNRRLELFLVQGSSDLLRAVLVLRGIRMVRVESFSGLAS